jgi:hypothetical protein
MSERVVALTKRELIAAMALQGLLAAPDSDPENRPFEQLAHNLAYASVAYADALLAALKEAS